MQGLTSGYARSHANAQAKANSIGLAKLSNSKMSGLVALQGGPIKKPGPKVHVGVCAQSPIPTSSEI